MASNISRGQPGRCAALVGNLVAICFIFSLFPISVKSSQISTATGANGDWHDEDTIIVQAENAVDESLNSHSRVKRQYYQYQYRPQVYSAPSVFYNLVSPAGHSPPQNMGKYSSCMSAKGEPGTCVQLKQCYPFMYGFDLENDGKYRGNMELARMLTESTGSCMDARFQNINHINTNGNGINYYQYQANSDQGNSAELDLICCTGNYTNIDIPPMESPKVIGGFTAAKGKFPFIVALMNNGRQFCGGSMIDSNHVLTAAHCVAHMSGTAVTRLTAQIGDHDIYSSSDGTHQVRKILRVIKHKRFSASTLHNDVALLTLTSPVTSASNVQTVGLSSAGSTGTATVAGWGRLFDGGQFPSVLHYSNVPIWTNAKCAQTYGRLAPGGIQDHMMCAGSTSSDACSGDSGGPLTIGGSQVGIVSWGIGCGRYPGVYTRVSSFTSWIQKNQRH